MAHLPPEFRQLKDRTPINTDTSDSSYVFYYKGNPTQQQIHDHVPVPEWSEPLLGTRCAERYYVYVNYGQVHYKRPIGHQCVRRTVIGTRICW